ncbi:MAG: ABC transporter permease, partial [Candidatus Eremiobacteraeota bacterium]|nr:ABC transporter permease [Candidatus Eremiobacteraeota bacterium]
MSFAEAIRLALQQIRVQKLKSFFTLMGVTIGVMFLIAVVSVVNGMGRYVEQDFAGKFLGVNTFTLRKIPDVNSDYSSAEWQVLQRRPNTTWEDALAVRDALPRGAGWAVQNSRFVSPETRYVHGGPQVIAWAVTPGFFSVKNLVVERGRAFGDQEEALGAPVAVIGRDVAKDYFPGLDPLGRTILVDHAPYQVIGVLEQQGTVFGLNLDRQIIGPFTSPLHRATRSRPGIDGVMVRGANPAEQASLQETVREVMRRRHKLRPTVPDDFALESSESALVQWLSIKKYLVLAGIALPAIGLVVGAIVIMNIMLVAVAERTREIGVRKSLGARRRDILGQFLAESTTLSVLGAALGVALGVALAAIVKAATPLPTAVALWSVLVSVGLGAGVGIVAGVYPASRAARLDPITA